MLDKPIFKKERKSLDPPPQAIALFLYFALEQNFYKELLFSSKLKIQEKKETKMTNKHGKICNLRRNQGILNLEIYHLYPLNEHLKISLISDLSTDMGRRQSHILLGEVQTFSSSVSKC